MSSEQLTKELVDELTAPLPKEALKQHPTKNYLTTINAAYVIERLNKVFGVNGWDLEPEIIETGQMIVVKGVLSVPKYGIRKVAFGGNDNPDRGDAFKGGCTDALTKAASFLGIGAEVYKNEVKAGHTTPTMGRDEIAVVKAQQKNLATQLPKPTVKTQAAIQGQSKPGHGEIENDILQIRMAVVDTASGQYGDYLKVTYFGTFELPDGRRSKPCEVSVNCYKKNLFGAVKEAHLKPAAFKVERKGKYWNIIDVIEIDGVGYEEGVKVVQLDRGQDGITDSDIPF